MMKEMISQNELLSFSKEKLDSMVGKKLFICKVDGTQLNITLKSFLCAINPPHLYCGFVSTAGEEIGFNGISIIELVENDNLQTRRQFFKKAVHHTLPILGTLLLGPTLFGCEKDDEDDDRDSSDNNVRSCTEYNCTQQCSGTCRYTCLGGCKGTSGGGCKGMCLGACDASCGNSCVCTCVAECAGGCSKGGCYTSCQTTCTGGNNRD